MIHPPPPAAPRPSKGRLVAVLAAAFAFGAGSGSGQAPPLKTEVAGLEPFRCAVAALPPPTSAEEAAQAVQMGTTARQAVILGDLGRARELLERAVSLDPSSPALAYQYGRILEDLGETREAVVEYCRALASGASDEDALDARARVDAYAEASRRRVPPEALEAFRAGVTAFGQGRIESALGAFVAAGRAHSDLPEAAFNRGVSLETLGRGVEAAEAYRAYLELRPDAPDAIQVSEKIGQLQVVQERPSPGSALALGMLLPGGGQFYTGRPLGGVALLALAGGAAAVGFLVEEVDVRCLRPVESGQACPPSDVVARDVTKPYLTYGLAGAGALVLAGAIEAFLHARGIDDVEVASLGGSARLLGPSLQARGRRADVRFFRVTF